LAYQGVFSTRWRRAAYKFKMNPDKSETTFQRMNDRSLSCKEFFARERLKNTRRVGGGFIAN